MPQSWVWPRLPHFCKEMSSWQLPCPACCPGLWGCRGLCLEGKGSWQEQLGEARVFPTSGRQGRRRAWAQAGWLQGLELPGLANLCPPQPSLGSWLPGSQGPGQEPFGPSSLLCSALATWALCCTYPRLVFIPCENDRLFLLSVSVFMCAELLACCARARGELLPGDWPA